MTKKISIIVPCCNVEKYVEECLESIAVQTYTNLEVICIDDGSKDSTGVIVDRFVERDSRFKVLHKPNSGYGDSMNKGLEMCTGEYIGIIESDDWIEPNMFETLYEVAEENNLDVARCCWLEGPTGTENVNDQGWVKKNEVYCPLDREETLHQQPAIWVSLYKRELIENGRKIRFLPTPGASFQDTSFAFKIYTKAQRFMMIDKCLHHYRINPNSSVSSTGKIFCISDEWEEMISWIIEEPVLKERFSKSSLLADIFYGGFNWNYHRLSLVPRMQFLHRACSIFRNASEKGLFNLDSISDVNKKNTILTVMNDPLKFYREETFGEVNRLFDNAKEINCNKMTNDCISVIIPCYNTAKYILATLESVIRQNYDNLDIICVDDCSTDETQMLVRHMIKKDKRISLLCTKKNSGQSTTRNLALKHCKGKYIIFLDGDDCLTPNAITILLNKVEENADLIASSISVSYEEGEEAYGSLPKSDTKYYTNTRAKTINATHDIDEVYKLNVSLSGKLWKADIIRNFSIQFLDGMLYEDANFYWKYISVAPRIKIITESTYLYHRHLQGSVMSNTYKKVPGMSIQHILILNDMFSFYTKNNVMNIGHKILAKVYEPFFWFAYNNAPKEDYDKIFTTMCNILKEQEADVSSSSILKYISKYDELEKSDLFIGACEKGALQTLNSISMSPESIRIYKKYKKYRRLTMRLIFVASALLLITIISIVCQITNCL